MTRASTCQRRAQSCTTRAEDQSWPHVCVQPFAVSVALRAASVAAWRHQKPDCNLIRAYGRKHILFENKVTSPVDSQGQPTTPEAAVAACGGTAPALRDAIEDKYVHARRKGHIVVPLLHEVFGGIAPETIKFVAEAAARTRGRKLADHDDPSAPWSAPTLSPYLFQSISVALHTAVANQILDRVAEEDGLAALGSA